MDMKTKLAAAGLTVGLIGGGVAGAMLSSSGISGATAAVVSQDGPTTEPTTTGPSTTGPSTTGPSTTGPSTTEPTTTGPSTTGPSTTGQAPADPGQAPADDNSAAETPPPDRGHFLADTLAPLVKDGTITQEQADKVIEAIKAARPERPAHRHPMARAAGGKAAADALGMTPAALAEALRSGSTIAEVAKAQGVDVQKVIDAMVAEAKIHLDKRVARGGITQAQADRRLAEATTRITDMVNNGPRHEPFGGPPAKDGGD